MSALLQRRPIMSRFRLPMPKEQAAVVLKGAIMAEVARRHRVFTDCDALASQLEQMAEWLTTSDRHFCLLLCGRCGNGKTTFVKALQSLLNYLDLKDEHYGETWGFQIVDARELSRMSREDPRQWEGLTRRRMLAIDDIGTEPETMRDYGNELHPVTDLLYKRYDEQLCTIMTTNLLPSGIREKYGDRIADRMSEVACKIVFENDSYRTNF